MNQISHNQLKEKSCGQCYDSINVYNDSNYDVIKTLQITLMIIVKNKNNYLLE